MPPKQQALLSRRREVARLHQEACALGNRQAPGNEPNGRLDTAIKLLKGRREAALRPATPGRKPGSGSASTRNSRPRSVGACARRRSRRGSPDTSGTDSGAGADPPQVGIEITDRAVGNYLARWGVAGQKTPNTRTSWFDDNRDAIAARVHEHDAEVYWANKRITLGAALWTQPSDATSDEEDEDGGISAWVTEDAQRGRTTLASTPPPRQAALARVLRRLWREAGAQVSQRLDDHTKRKAIFLIKHDKRDLTNQAVKEWLETTRWVKGEKARLHLLPPLPPPLSTSIRK